MSGVERVTTQKTVEEMMETGAVARKGISRVKVKLSMGLPIGSSREWNKSNGRRDTNLEQNFENRLNAYEFIKEAVYNTDLKKIEITLFSDRVEGMKVISWVCRETLLNTYFSYRAIQRTWSKKKAENLMFHGDRHELFVERIKRELGL